MIDPSRRRRIKRDLYNVPKKGVAGLRLNSQDEEIIREIRGAERPASPASDNMGTMRKYLFGRVLILHC